MAVLFTILDIILDTVVPAVVESEASSIGEQIASGLIGEGDRVIADAVVDNAQHIIDGSRAINQFVQQGRQVYTVGQTVYNAVTQPNDQQTPA